MDIGFGSNPDVRIALEGGTRREMRVEIAPRIILDENIHFGKPVIVGTRVPVDIVLGKLAGGMSYDEVMAEYDVTREDILAVLRYAAKLVSGEEVLVR